jgi:hypothetical protein
MKMILNEEIRIATQKRKGNKNRKSFMECVKSPHFKRQLFLFSTTETPTT